MTQRITASAFYDLTAYFFASITAAMDDTQTFDLRTLRRERLKMTQEQLAAALGMTQETISRFETGGLPINVRTRLAVEALLLRQAA